MSETRKPGNPGGTRGTHNAPHVDQPRSTTNTGGSAPAGERQKPNPIKQIGPRKGHSIR